MPDNTSPAEIADRVTEEDSAKTKIWPMPPTGSTAADTTPPVVNTATVEGNQLVLTYTEAGALDPIALVLNAGFTVNTATAAITVTGVAMNITAKTVTLTLSRAVAVAETVTVNYTKPTFGQGVRDVAGNNAANFSNMAVTNNTQVDTTPPVINIAVVNGNQLELMYTEANSLDGAALAGNAGFTVHSAAGRAITVTGAVVDATTKIVTLTLSRTVAHGETVSVSYVKPGAGNVVQDAAGNDAVNFSNWAVRNDTPEAAADTTPPEFHSATVRGNQLVIHYTDQSDLDDVSLVELVKNDNLYVRSDGLGPNGSPTWWKSVIGSAVVDATAKTVTLTLLHRMPHDRTVTVTYTKPGAGNVLQDVHGNQAASFDGKPVTNNTPTGADTTAPVLSSATVNGNQLVLTYIEAENLSGYLLEGNAGFTVSSAGGTAITVTGAVVDATHNTVTLTLSRAVAYRETVTLSHTMAGVEDVAGNDTADFSNRDVTNITPAPPDTTPPEINTATVTGNQLVLTYTEANTLDGAALAGNAGFTVNNAAGTAAITVSSAVVNATAKTVTLTLSRAVAATETVTVSYTKPESGAVVQDAAGNDAVSFSDRAVTNNTSSATIPDTLTTIASVECSDLVLSANETCTYTIVFTRAVDPLTFSLADLKTVRPGTYEVITNKGELSNLRTTDGNITWKFDLKAPDSGNSTDNLILLYIEDVTDKEGRRCGGGTLSGANGDGRYPFTTHTYTIDTTAPEINTATVNGNQLVLTYTEANTLDGAALAGNAGFTVNNAAGTAAITVSSAVVNATTKTVTLTLSRAVANTETVTVSYTKPESGAVVQDAAGNDAVNFSSQAVTNSTPGTTPGADTTAPEINTAVVTGDKLVLTYTEAGTLDATALVRNAGFTVNTAAGTTAITVTGVAVHITDKTVTLTLSRAVAATETVTVSYTKPTLGNGVRDAAGNEAANFREKAVTHSTPADTTAPEINTAVVTGDKLVLTYTEAGTLDGAALAGNAGFTVNTAAGATAITVSSAVVNATAKTVTLTLSRTVAATETVTVSYTKPESGAVVQDAAGNDAANFSSQPVTHSTATPPGTQGPTLAATDPITISDNKLSFGESATVTIRFAEAIATDSFTTADLTVGGGAKLSNLQSTDGGTTWTVMLAAPDALDIAANVLLVNGSTGNKISVNLAGITNRAGTAGVGTVDSTITYDIDVQSPSVSSAAVNGDQLVLTYTEANTLDGAALAGNAGFTVNTAAGAAAITVSSAVVNATAKTVTLTLSRTVAATETVTVSYTKPATGAVVQDAAGNDAANFSDRAVTHGTTPAPADTTPPVFSSAVVNGNRLVLTYTEAGTLDGAALAGNAGFTVNTAAGATAITVSSAVVNATAKTVTLTLSRAVAATETVTVSYTKPESGAVVQDAAGNDAANFSSRAVTNNTQAPPELNVEITLADSALTTGETTTVTFTFTRPVNGFDISDIVCRSGTLSTLVANAESTVWTATFTPTANVNAPENFISVNLAGVTDNAGNAGEAEVTSPNYTVNTTGPAAADTVAPVINTAVVTGNQLVLTYTEANTLDGAALAGNAGFTVNTAAGATAITVSSAVVNATAKTVTLTLSRTVAATETVTVSYTKPESGAVVQDAAGNDAVSFSNQAVTHGTRSDTTAPVINTAVVTGDKLVLSYTEEGNLDAANTAAASAFAVNSAGNAAISVNSVAVSGKTVTLTLSRAVTSTETLTVSYTKPTGNNVVQDAAGNDAVSFSNQTVTHGTPSDTTAPVLNTAVVIGNQLVLSYIDEGNLDATNTAAASAFAVNSAGNAVISVRRVAVSGKTVTLTLSRPVTSAETLTVSYTKPTSGDNVVQDAAGNDAVSFSNQTVTHRTRSDTTAPEINTAVVTGNQLVLTYTEAGTLDAAALAGNAGFTVNTAAGATAITVSSAVVNATAKTVTLTLSRAVAATETVSVSYTKPESGAVVQDAAGNDAANFSERAVTNNTPGTTPGADTTAPEINTAVVTGDKLVLTYREAGTLDATALLGNAGFTVNTAAGTTAITVTGVAVHITDKTVTLTLSRAVAATETVTVSYTKPTFGNGVRDAAGNEAVNFSNQAVTHGTPSDTTAPEFSSATVNGDRLVITYTEAGTLDGAALAGNAGFTVNTAAGAAAITVSSAVVNATAKTVTLTLSRTVAATETVTVSYIKPESGAVVQDAAGNDAANFSSQPVTHSTATPPGTQGPTLAATNPITISDDKLHLGESVTVTIRFSEAIATDSFTTADLTVGGGATLSNLQSTDGGTTWTVTLTAPGFLDILLAPTADRNSTGNKISVNLAGITNRAGTAGAGTAESTVTYDIDVTPPSVSSAAVNGDQLVLSFIDANILGDTALTGSAGFTVGSTTGTAITVNSAVINATVKTVTLTLSRAVTSSETVSVSYTKPESGNVVRDAAGNGASDFSGQAVTNNTPATPAPADTTPPVINAAVVTGDKLVLTYTEANTLDAAALAGNAGFTVNTAAGATAITVSSAVVNATAKTVTLTLSRAVAATETVTVSYTKPESGAVVQDAAGNDAVSFSNQAVTHGTPSDTTAPVINTAVVTGDKLVLSYTEEGSLDAVNTAAASAFAVSSAGNAAISVNSVAVSGKTVTLTLSRTVATAETVTVSYTKPTGDNVV
ncbi:SwmB domain-containing protein, partial [Verminephrobacter aporrectodeae]|uniref:SwmB domain-containing protein n=2 Tax=Verminephrobacter aporrectodeae TaxID=1110389 RepID=UPI002244DB3C